MSMRVLTAQIHAIEAAAQVLRAGGLVAFPTETVYGLGADATQGRAVAAIFAAKGRPRFNPLIVHVADLAAAEALAEFTTLERRLAEVFWPGPLTLVLPRRPGCGISELVSAGLDTVAVRVPSHPVAQALLRAAAVPVAAPSANVSGHVSATTAAHVAADFGASGVGIGPDGAATELLILDAGPATLGLESTVVAVTQVHEAGTGGGVALLRPGAVPAAAIETILGRPLPRLTAGGDRPSSPGQLASHYAPRARLRLDAREVLAGEALLAFGPGGPPVAGPVRNLSPSGDLVEAAANLFAALRSLDATGVAGIAVVPIPSSGLGEAINDRLQRAAAGR